MADRPPIELHVEIETADGLAQYRWDAHARQAEDRPQGLSCTNTLMNGFAEGRASLARNIDRSYPDLGLYDTIRFVGTDGRIAYEGRGSRYPRDASTVHRINAEAVGWMTHARDKPITFLGIDGRLSSWGEMTASRALTYQGSGFAPKGMGTVAWDGLTQVFEGTWVSGELPICEAWFDAGPGQGIGAVYYNATPGVNTGENTDFVWAPAVCDDRIATNAVGPGNLAGAPANTGTYSVTAKGKRYAIVQFYHTAPGGSADVQWTVTWNRLVVYGDHGLTPVGLSAPLGLLGSDLIRYTAGLAAPLLDTSGILPTVHPIDLFAYPDPTPVYEMWLGANQYERWNLAVWEDRRLTYAPLPDAETVTDPTWVLRSDHRNSLQRAYDGPSTDGRKNGIIVRYQNIATGEADMLTPQTTPSLADTDTRLAANRAGIDDWTAIQLPNPNSDAGAARIGQAALAEFNRQRTPGRFQITGHIRDRAGNWHPGWMARAGDTVLLEEAEDDPVRVVHEVQWSQDSRQLTINADAASRTIDAIVADLGV